LILNLIYFKHIVPVFRNIAKTGENFTEIKDPMHTSDEEFFGLWDSAADEGKGNWSRKPVLRYDLFPELSPVLTAVMASDYQKAKDKLLLYYRTRPEKKPFPLKQTSSGFPSLQAEMDIEKIIGWTERESPAGEIMHISPKWKWHSLSLDRFDMKTFNVLDVDMDGSTIEIHSKENPSGNAPYIEAVVDGKTIKFKCVSDTYKAPEKTEKRTTEGNLFFIPGKRQDRMTIRVNLCPKDCRE